MHEVETSHMNILDAICPLDQIRKGYSEAEKLGYKGHEFGDIASPKISLAITDQSHAKSIMSK